MSLYFSIIIKSKGKIFFKWIRSTTSAFLLFQKLDGAPLGYLRNWGNKLALLPRFKIITEGKILLFNFFIFLYFAFNLYYIIIFWPFLKQKHYYRTIFWPCLKQILCTIFPFLKKNNCTINSHCLHHFQSQNGTCTPYNFIKNKTKMQ